MSGRDLGRASALVHVWGLFLISFVMSGNGNVLPQMFYGHNYPQDKVFFLAACLLGGTTAAIVGVQLSRAGQLARGLGLLAVTLLVSAECGRFGLTGAIPYLLANALAQLAANYLMNALDHAAAARVADSAFYDGAGNGARLLGMLAAPAFFTSFYERRALIWAVLLVGASPLLYSVLSLGGSAEGRQQQEAAGPARPADRADRLLFGYAIALYGALYLFAANLIYLLDDVLRIPDAQRRGGLTIVATFAAALLSNGLASALRRRPSTGRSLPALAAPALLLAAMAALIGSGRDLSYGAVLAGASIVGAAYGVFLLEVRAYASRGARDEGKRGLLTLFNNMANISSLLAFGAMLGLAALRGSAGASYPVLLGLIAAMPLLGLISLGMAASGWRVNTRT